MNTRASGTPVFSRWLAVLGLLLLACGARGHDVPAVVLPISHLTLEHGEVSMYRDERGAMSLAEVMQAEATGGFTPLHGALTRGYTNDVYWLRLVLRNDGDAARYWLEVMPAFLDDLRLYEIQPGGSVRLHRNGDRTPALLHDAPTPTPYFRLDLPSGTTTLYLRIKSTSSMVAMLSIHDLRHFQKRVSTQGIFYGMYFGLLGAILLLNVLNWWLLRDSLFGIYVGYIAVQVVYFAAGYGISAQYFFPDFPAVSDRLVGVGLGMTLAIAAIFYARLLDIRRENAPVAWAGVAGAVAIGTIGAISALANFYVYAAPVMQVWMLVVFLSTLRHLARLAAHGTFEQRLASASFLLYMLPVLLGALSFAGLIEASRNTIFAAQLGNGLHLWLLHFVIARSVREAELAREEFARQAAVARVEAEQAKRRNEEQADLLSMITHEVRTPAAVIRSAMESLRLVDPSPSPERATRYQRIDRSARRMSALIELLSTADRMPRPTHAVPVPVDLLAMTRDMVSQVDPEQESRVVVHARGGPFVALASPEMLAIALSNLIDNALKYSPPGSPVTVTLARTGGQACTWQVEDRGPGVPDGERERIFDKYWRGGESGGAPGLGLGLYIVREIVESVGGTVVCGESPHGGARFLCTFPAVEPAATHQGVA